MGNNCMNLYITVIFRQCNYRIVFIAKDLSETSIPIFCSRQGQLELWPGCSVLCQIESWKIPLRETLHKLVFGCPHTDKFSPYISSEPSLLHLMQFIFPSWQCCEEFGCIFSTSAMGRKMLVYMHTPCPGPAP